MDGRILAQRRDSRIAIDGLVFQVELKFHLWRMIMTTNELTALMKSVFLVDLKNKLS